MLNSLRDMARIVKILWPTTVGQVSLSSEGAGGNVGEC